MNFHRRDAWFALAVLLSINAVNFYDRQVLGAVTEPLRRDWGLSDTQAGALGTAFILLYAVAGVPLGRAADAWSRKILLAFGLVLWSVLTGLSGISWGFWSLFAFRMGVGIGEAACAPAATSLIGDLFVPQQRGRAMSVFMMGLPVGLSLSYLVSGAMAQHYGWRSAFLVAGIPGLFLAGLILLVTEPERGAAEAAGAPTSWRAGSPYKAILTTPTMIWIIASGALHNFNMYAISAFLPALLTRYHGASVQRAGFISGILIGAVGAVGTLLGGWLGDASFRRRQDGRMLLSCAAIMASVPLSLFALAQPPGATVTFVLLLALALLMMYVYYPAVYASIHDILEPSLRGTGMAVYFLAMYLLGASLGPLAAGWLSDHLALSAARGAAVRAIAVDSLPEPFRAVGLLRAMYVVPVVGVILAAVLFSGSRTIARDIARLNHRLGQQSTE